MRRIDPGWCALVTAVALLAACGGSSKTAKPPATSPRPPVPSAAAHPPAPSPSPAITSSGSIAFAVAAGRGTAVAVVRGGTRIALPASFVTGGTSYPVGWVDAAGRYLLVAQQEAGGNLPDYFVLDLTTKTVVGGPVPADGGLAVAVSDGSAVIGGLDGDRVFRYDSNLNEVSSAVITGLPHPASSAEQPIDVLGVRTSGIVVALPGSDGTGRDTAAYGGPERIATIDWKGRGQLLPALPYFNVAVSGAAISPDGKRLAVVIGGRAGAADNEFVPRVIDLDSGVSQPAPRPAALAAATELYVHDLHWVDATTLSYAWENSGSNGDWSQPVGGNVPEIPPTIYTWSPGSAPVAGASATLFAATLTGGYSVTVGWSASAAAQGGPFPLAVDGTVIGELSSAAGVPVLLAAR
jgi:hypothetical protein